jgi:hypothetical protein
MPDDGQSPKPPVILNVMLHHQNPLESKYKELTLLNFCAIPEKEFHIGMSLYDYTISGYGKGGKGKVVPVLQQLNNTPWRRMGEWRYSSIILDLFTRWR